MANFHEFRCEYHNPKYDAQRNLAGISHYADDDTLKYFKARIVATFHEDHGLTFTIVETLPDDSGKRVYRAVMFNIFGSTIATADYPTKAKALAALTELTEPLDSILDWVQDCGERHAHKLAQTMCDIANIRGNQ